MSDARLTRTGERVEELGDYVARKIDFALATTELQLRTIQTHGLIGIVKIYPTAMVLATEALMSHMMMHPVIFPSPIGLEFGHAVNKLIGKVKKIRVRVIVEEDNSENV